MFTKKKAVFIAAAAVLVIGTAGFASKLYTVTYSGHSTSYPQYKMCIRDRHKGSA